ncbi:MAG: hypothetical protein VYA51_04200 [Planctomycetota bacterium]|nr:hypothetical protein [Planctomycetota bacterium]
MRPLLLAAVLLSPLACDGGGGGPREAGERPGLATEMTDLALALDHDFGVLPHGAARTHEFEIDLSQLGEPYIPLRVHLECSCGRADLRYRDEAGRERFPDGSAFGRNLPATGERAFLHIELDTRKKEAVDIPKTASRGYILLQQVQDPNGMGRIRWPFVIRFAIDAPVELRPFAALDFGAVPQSMRGQLTTTLRGDEGHRDLKFLDARSTDGDLQVTLEAKDELTVLRAVVTPNQLGSHRAAIAVRTSDPDYQVGIAATWKVIPDLEAAPMSKISFTTDLNARQDAAALMRQFVLVTDHNADRTPEFTVAEIVAADGSDASRHFRAELSPVPTAGRQQRLAVQYLGGLKEAFRGRIVLGKPGETSAVEAPRIPIDLVVFHKKKP